MHLIKGIRNNLLTKDLLVNNNEIKNTNKKYASWEDIVTIYEMDKYSYTIKRQMPNITDKHVYPAIIQKMKVKYATQIFSATVANYIDVVLTYSKGK